MNDSLTRLWMAVRAVATTAAMMTVLVTAIAFVLETTVHDWYATGKVTLAEAMIATGFDQSAQTEYWTVDGRTVRRSRYGLTISEAWVVRRRLLSMAADRALLGACTGLVVGFLWLRAPKAVRPSRPVRFGVFARPAQGFHRPEGFPGGPFSGWYGSGSDQASSALLVASETEFESLAERGGGVNAAGDPRVARSGAKGPARPEPPRERRAETVTGKESTAASAGGGRRKRDYGRWI